MIRFSIWLHEHTHTHTHTHTHMSSNRAYLRTDKHSVLFIAYRFVMNMACVQCPFSLYCNATHRAVMAGCTSVQGFKVGAALFSDPSLLRYDAAPLLEQFLSFRKLCIRRKMFPVDAMKACGRSIGIDPFILKLGARRR
jgi:hypothetical protein